jgi:type I restriction-modification system DNA methylase subunit
VTNPNETPSTAQPDLHFERELWETAVTLRGTVAPADYKHYVLPMLFLRYLSLRYEQRRGQLQMLLKDPQSEYYTGDPETDGEILEDPSEYARDNVLVVPEEASWDYLRRNARAGDIKLRLDNAMKLLEERHPRLQGVLPRIYSGSNLEVDQVAGLINLFSRDIFARQNGADLLGRTYEYFIGNFASSEGTRGGTHGSRYRRDEILFVDARGMGQMVTRRQRALTDEEIARIAQVYRRFKRYDLPDDEPGFCKIATLDQVQAHDCKLTPGIYVGTQADDGEEEPFEEAIPRMIEELRGLFAESHRLQDEILGDLEGLL